MERYIHWPTCNGCPLCNPTFAALMTHPAAIRPDRIAHQRNLQMRYAAAHRDDIPDPPDLVARFARTGDATVDARRVDSRRPVAPPPSVRTATTSTTQGDVPPPPDLVARLQASRTVATPTGATPTVAAQSTSDVPPPPDLVAYIQSRRAH